MKTLNTIPKGDKPLATLATTALRAAEDIGAAAGLAQNTAVKMAPEVRAFTGSPLGAAPAVPGKLNLLSQAVSRRGATATELRKTIADGRAFATTAVDLLKNRLGRRWNAQWVEAGFTGGSLAIPNDPGSLLGQLRDYFTQHPAHESEEFEVSAVKADALLNALDTARRAAAASHSAQKGAKRAKDAAARTLRKRMTALRNELAQLLDPEDERWYDFGFKRPVDSRIPEPVASLTLHPGAAGEVIAKWKPAVRAKNYRVTKQVENVDAEPVEVDIVSDPFASVTGLPAKATVTIRVSARRDASEAKAAEAVITLP